jgi:23S rRNA pseudouridine1911/1915/1917 synthase
MMPRQGGFTLIAGGSDEGKRLDAFLFSHLPDCSRSYAAQLVSRNEILVNGLNKKPGYRIHAGDRVEGCIPPPALTGLEPEPIPIDVIFQDHHLIVINKQPGLVVHPAPGHDSGTLVNALLYHCPDIEPIGGELRPGIVHRLDKDTSGVMVVAKTARALEALSAQFKSRSVRKIYLALAHGLLQDDAGSIDLPIGRHPIDRKRMSTVSRKPRRAETRWRVRERLKGMTLLELELKTGRTHQIRVHCAAIGHPIVGDPVYRRRKCGIRFNPGDQLESEGSLHCQIQAAGRQMLHACRLEFAHPQTGRRMAFEASPPTDMQTVIDALKKPAQG